MRARRPIAASAGAALLLLGLGAGLVPARAAAAPDIARASRVALAALSEPGGPGRGARESGGDAATAAGEAEVRSPYRAFLLSMILPGLGQRYLGSHNRALAFFIGEAGLWTTYTVFKIQGNMREEDFEEWAEVFAGAKIDGHGRDEEYFQTISKYLSSDDYNRDVREFARLLYPGDREAQLAYIEENSLGGDDTWEWASNERRNQYRIIRHGALEADRRANWTLGGLVLLRVVSAIDAALETRGVNRRLRGDLSVSPSLPSGEPGVALGYSRPF